MISPGTQRPSKPTAHIYFTEELKFETTELYNSLNLDINAKWKFDDERVVGDPAGVVGEVMRRQPALRLFWVGGYYDITTPLANGKYILNRASVPSGRLTVAAFDTGHMPYEGDQNLARFVASVKQFVAGGHPAETARPRKRTDASRSPSAPTSQGSIGFPPSEMLPPGATRLGSAISSNCR